MRKTITVAEAVSGDFEIDTHPRTPVAYKGPRFDPEEFREIQCPDGGACHHRCEQVCFRVNTCEPLSDVFENDEWPLGVRLANMTLEHYAVLESRLVGAHEAENAVEAPGKLAAREAALEAVGEHVLLDHWWLDAIVENAADAATNYWKPILSDLVEAMESLNVTFARQGGKRAAHDAYAKAKHALEGDL